MSEPIQIEPRQWQEAERWIARSDEDVRAAEGLLALTPPAIGPAAFHCQQAAEKIAKAVLIAVRQPPTRLHDIDELGRRIRPQVPEIGEALEALGGLTRWYSSTRYPDTGLESGPTAAEVRDALASLRDLRQRLDLLGPTKSAAPR